MDDVLDELRSLADSPPTSPEPLERLRGRAARLRRRRRWACGPAGLAVVLVCGGGVTVALRDTTESRPVAVEVGGGPTMTAPAATTTTTAAAVPSTVAITAPPRSPAWTVPGPTRLSSLPNANHPVAAGDLLLVPTGGGDLRLRAYRAGTGAEAWEYRASEPVMILAAGDGIVVVAPQYGRLIALNLATGSERWQFALRPTASAGRATIAGGRVYVGASHTAEASVDAPVVAVLDQATGRPLWQTPLDEGTDLLWAPPELANGLVLVGTVPSHPGSALTSHLHAVDGATGTRRWRADLHSDRPAFHDLRPVVAGGSVYTVGGQGDLLALDAATGEERWSRRSDRALPVIAGVARGQVVAKMGGEVVGLDAVTGDQQWRVPASRTPRSGMAWAGLEGDVAYVVEPGRAFAVKMPGGEVLWDLAIETVQPPAFAAGTAYLAGPERLVAVDLVTGEPEWAAPVAALPFSAATVVAGAHVVVAAADATMTAVPR